MQDFRGYCPMPEETIPDYGKQEFSLIFHSIFLKGFLIWSWIIMNYLLWICYVLLKVIGEQPEGLRDTNLFSHIIYSFLTVVIVLYVLGKPRFIRKIKPIHWTIFAYLIIGAVIILGAYNEYHKYWF